MRQKFRVFNVVSNFDLVPENTTHSINYSDPSIDPAYFILEELEEMFPEDDIFEFDYELENGITGQYRIEWK